MHSAIQMTLFATQKRDFRKSSLINDLILNDSDKRHLENVEAILDGRSIIMKIIKKNERMKY